MPIEGIKLDFMIELAGMERVEIGDAINAEHDRPAINDELLVSVFQCRFDDPRISLRSIVSTSRGLDRLLQKSAMTAEEIGRLRKAYELTLRGIGVEDRDDPLAERIAKEIVEAGQAGLTDPAEISSLVVERLRM